MKIIKYTHSHAVWDTVNSYCVMSNLESYNNSCILTKLTREYKCSFYNHTGYLEICTNYNIL